MKGFFSELGVKTASSCGIIYKKLSRLDYQPSPPISVEQVSMDKQLHWRNIRAHNNMQASMKFAALEEPLEEDYQIFQFNEKQLNGRNNMQEFQFTERYRQETQEHKTQER
jgi:hypothetical protein